VCRANASRGGYIVARAQGSRLDLSFPKNKNHVYTLDYSIRIEYTSISLWANGLIAVFYPSLSLDQIVLGEDGLGNFLSTSETRASS
jgi:hypothetical protein